MSNHGVVVHKPEDMGVTEFSKTNRAQFIIFPNPAHNFIQVESKSEGMKISSIDIINHLGESFQLLNGVDGMYDIRRFRPGVYILEIYSGLKVFSEKLIIN